MGTLRDVRHALRLFSASKATTIVIIMTLALSIGANTALFSVIDAVWLNAIPYPEAPRLVQIANRNDQFPNMAVSWFDADDWRAQTEIFEDVALFARRAARIGPDPEAPFVPSRVVEPRIFRLLNEVPLAGRLLVDEDATSRAEPVVVISERLWRKDFGSDPDAVGRPLAIGGKPVTIVGVAPERLRAILDCEIIRPLVRPSNASRGLRDLSTVAKLRSDVSMAAAQARLTEVSMRAAELYPNENATWRAHVDTLRDALVGADVGRMLLLLGSVVGLVLLIGCSSVASLLVARTTTRTNEMTVRAALGASRLRLTRQLLTESLLLSTLASIAALVMVYFTRDALLAVMPKGIPRAEEIGINGQVLAFAIGVTLLTALLAGSLPALKLSTLGRLRAGDRGQTTGARRLTGLLLAGESALSVVVLVLAGLVVVSFIRLLQVDAGFTSTNVVLFNLSSPPRGATTTAADDASVLEELRRLPYVRAAGAIDQSPLGGGRVTYSFTIVGAPVNATAPEIDLRRATPAYFAALGIPLKQGRDFAPTDLEGAPLVAIINERAARTYWPGENPLGKQVKVGGPNPVTIVGVVGDVRHFGLDRDPAPELYRPWAQQPLGALNFVVRVDQNPEQLVASLADPSRRLAGTRRIQTVSLFDQQVSESVRAPRFRMLLFALLGTLVLTLTVVGVAGVSAQAVTTRTREMGIRLAIGARPGQIVSLLVRQSALPVSIGCAAGAVAAWWSARIVEGFVFGISVHNPLILVSAAALLLVFAVLAAWVPARAVTTLDPSVALRDQ